MPKMKLFCLIAVVMIPATFICPSEPPSNLVIIAIDAATWDVITPMIEQGELPGFKHFVKKGCSGRLISEMTRLPSNLSYNVFTPVAFTSIATGKAPEQHNIHDFVSGYGKTGFTTEIDLTGILNEPGVIYLNLSTVQDISGQELTVYLNGNLIGKTYLLNKWHVYSFMIRSELLAEKNILEIHYTKRFAGEDWEENTDDNETQLAFAMQSLNFRPDANRDGEIQLDFSDHVTRKKYLGTGWYKEKEEAKIAWAGKLIKEPVTSDLLLADPFWRIFSRAGRTVSVVGWWITYPVEPVNGEMVSLHLGHRRDSGNINAAPPVRDTVYPEGFYEEIKKLVDKPGDILPLMDKEILDISEFTKESGEEKANILKEIFWQDNLFHKIGKHILKTRDRDVFAIYYEGIDTVQHMTWRFRIHDNYKHSRLYHAVSNWYRYQDRLIREYLKLCSPSDYIMLISDHGFGDDPAQENKGDHKLEGIFALVGPGVTNAEVKNISIYDILPTMLYIQRMPLAKDMKGRVIKEAFAKSFRNQRPIEYIDTYEISEGNKKNKRSKQEEYDREYYERLRTIGYF